MVNLSFADFAPGYLFLIVFFSVRNAWKETLVSTGLKIFSRSVVVLQYCLKLSSHQQFTNFEGNFMSLIRFFHVTIGSSKINQLQTSSYFQCLLCEYMFRYGNIFVSYVTEPIKNYIMKWPIVHIKKFIISRKRKLISTFFCITKMQQAFIRKSYCVWVNLNKTIKNNYGVKIFFIWGISSYIFSYLVMVFILEQLYMFGRSMVPRFSITFRHIFLLVAF